MHICFHIRDDVGFNKFIHDIEAESARCGMTQFIANRVITVCNFKVAAFARFNNGIQTRVRTLALLSGVPTSLGKTRLTPPVRARCSHRQSPNLRQNQLFISWVRTN